MVDTPVNSAFADLVATYLLRRGPKGMKARAFAKAVGSDHTYMSRFLAAKRYPPENLEKWADFFGLTGTERDSFLELGYLTRCPQYIRDLVERQKSEIQRLSASAPES